MLRIVQLESIEAKLNESADLVEQYEEGDIHFVGNLLEWLSILSEELRQNRLAVASSLAAMRATLLSADRGILPPEFTEGRAGTSRKRKRAFAVSSLQRAVDTVQRVIEPDRERIDQAERIAVQVIAVARANSIIDPRVTDLNGSELRRFAEDLRAHNSTVQGIVQIESLTGPQDSLVVLDRMLVFSAPNNSLRVLSNHG